ncbi:MAG: HEPN domain-containing protein [Thermomicrobiales bacterium]|nr:HEPN domain-containing protein [Thermomicrobiales bacterium]
MSFAWHEFADLAEWLTELRSDEASQRTAINRAYYAAYHAASAFVRTHEMCSPDLHLSHQLVWRLIRESGMRHSIEIANLGYDLKDARVWADYRNPYPGPDHLASDVDKAIANSVAIIALLREP